MPLRYTHTYDTIFLHMRDRRYLVVPSKRNYVNFIHKANAHAKTNVHKMQTHQSNTPPSIVHVNLISLLSKSALTYSFSDFPAKEQKNK